MDTENIAGKHPSPAAGQAAGLVSCFKPAEAELRPLVEELIERHHPHLARARIAYLFREGRWVYADRPVRGRAVVVPLLWRLLCGSDLVLIVSEPVFLSLTEKGRRALLDHELTHFAEPRTALNGRITWRLRRHDVEEFAACVLRHRVCMSKLGEVFGENLVQMSLENLGQQVERPEIVAAVYNRPGDAKVIEETGEEGIYLCDDYVAEYGEDGRKGLNPEEGAE